MHVQGQRKHGETNADRKEDHGGQHERQHKAALVPMESRADEPPELLDDHRRGENNADVQRDLELEQDTATGLQVHTMMETGPIEQKRDHVAGEKDRSDSRDAPRDERDDEHPPQRLQVLDHGHAVVLDRSAGPRTALKDPV